MTTANYIKHTHKNPLERFLINNFYKTMFDILKTLKVESVLDVGCGEGFTLAKLKERGIGKHHEGIDIEDRAIRLGRKINPGLNLKKGDVYNLSHKNSSVDLVICTEVLEHLENPKKALLELSRVSKKYLLLSVPNEPWFILANFLRGKNWSRFGNDIEHIQHWTSKGFRKFNASFDVVSLKHPFPWTMVLLEKP
jgi:2-polyprenyl-3-methyl-5-hydroxy-6-metoxy-1,4-benzoquinol methylase